MRKALELSQHPDIPDKKSATNFAANIIGQMLSWQWEIVVANRSKAKAY